MSLRTSSWLSLFAIWIYRQAVNAQRPELFGFGKGCCVTAHSSTVRFRVVGLWEVIAIAPG